MADARESIARLEEERKENSERLRSQTNRANEIDEEVVQARTENDVLTIQIAEYTSTIESYRVRILLQSKYLVRRYLQQEYI